MYFTEYTMTTPQCPEVHAEFMKGHFVTQKTAQKVSVMAHDQVHEQLNTMVKRDGGAIGLTESSLRRWMMGGPGVARIITEYGDKFVAMHCHDDRHH